MGVGNEPFPSPSIVCAVSQLGMAQRCGLTRRQGNRRESLCDLPHDLGKVPAYEFSSLFQATSTPSTPNIYNHGDSRHKTTFLAAVF